MIDRDVANYMREHGYDLREYAQRNWATLGPKLAGKLHFFCRRHGRLLPEPRRLPLRGVPQEHARPGKTCEFTYGRPMKGHSGTRVTWAELVRRMGAHVQKNAPPGEDTKAWWY